MYAQNLLKYYIIHKLRFLENVFISILTRQTVQEWFMLQFNRSGFIEGMPLKINKMVK